ncbi:uncharacterized protein LOC106663028 [Cimex lectularius]|uniref:C-type lectin n=1 Tax=Cimex lectularius TaxID=79782 RepID=A0A8I6RD60_CIMLE|nr:uncharacterized protein LOC106663028 [Cimex lectularius]
MVLNCVIFFFFFFLISYEMMLVLAMMLPPWLFQVGLGEKEGCNGVIHLNVWGRGDWYAQYAYCRSMGMQLGRLGPDEVTKTSEEIKKLVQKDEPFFLSGNADVDAFSVEGQGCAVLEKGKTALRPCFTPAFAVCQFVS